MNRKLIAALCALVVGFSATTLVATEAAKSSDAPMYKASCPPGCDFTVKSHDKGEVAAVLKEHAKSHHNGMVVTDAQCDAMIKVVEPKK